MINLPVCFSVMVSLLMKIFILVLIIIPNYYNIQLIPIEWYIIKTGDIIIEFLLFSLNTNFTNLDLYKLFNHKVWIDRIFQVDCYTC